MRWTNVPHFQNSGFHHPRYCEFRSWSRDAIKNSRPPRVAGRRFRYCNRVVLVRGMRFGRDVIVAMPKIIAPMSSRVGY